MAIRVLHVIDHLGYGGAPIVVKRIVENTHGNAIEHFVLALRVNPNPPPIDAPVITLPYHKFSPRVLPAIPAVCHEHRIDIIHAHLQKSIIACLLVKNRCGIPVIIHGHGPVFGEEFGGVYRFMLRMLRRRVSHVIANSQATKTVTHAAAGIPLDRIDVIENFIDCERFDPARYDRTAARAELGLANDDIAIGFVGRFDVCKGIDLLLQAGRQLCEKNPHYRIILVGYGKEESSLRRLTAELTLQDKVIFTGLRKNPAELMAGFDLAVIPSRQEAFGIVALELMAMRVPVIASAVGGLPELVRHNETGLLLEKLSPDAIAQQVWTLINDPDLARNLIERATGFTHRFDGRNQVKAIEKIYLDISDALPI